MDLEIEIVKCIKVLINTRVSYYYYRHYELERINARFFKKKY